MNLNNLFLFALNSKIKTKKVCNVIRFTFTLHIVQKRKTQIMNEQLNILTCICNIIFSKTKIAQEFYYPRSFMRLTSPLR